MGLNDPTRRKILVRWNVLGDDDAEVHSPPNGIFVLLVLFVDSVPLVATDERLGLLVEDCLLPGILSETLVLVQDDERESGPADVDARVRLEEKVAGDHGVVL